jgi:tetratricopeptide (TPR) repeat protein
MQQQIDPVSFVEAVKPALASKDLQALLATCKSRWTAAQIISLLSSKSCDARKCAALALSLVGCPACLEPLSKQLKDKDPMVNQMAEHAMWAIWFRCGTPEANQLLTRGADLMSRREFGLAIEHFTRAIALSPSFAEAYNQRAIAYFLKEEFDRSIEDCQCAVKINPDHFGAWAGMGHCHAHEGRVCDAIRCYKRALEINPHLEGVQEAVAELGPCMDAEDAS